MGFRIKRVPHGTEIDKLQLACLPADEPVVRNQKNLCWLAYDDRGPVAFVIYQVLSNQQAYLARAGTLPRAQGKGLYVRLNRTAFSYLRKQGVTAAVTDCAYWNTSSANGLYRSGYRLFTPVYKWGFSDGLYWWADL
jgi:predicted GNAT family acetyltransferase